ncbi:MAG TPA: hypothetical protein VFU02_07960 [Polyangiaceae bacterium]|nr:hypothetical protein [Polyangiaceae bacterium]
MTFPMALGEGSGDPESAGTETKAAKPAAPETPAAPPPDPAAERRRKYGSLPDPTPLSLSSQWELELEYDQGKLALAAATPRELDTPRTTPRQMGRFAVELWIGHELIDRVRFDFPLVAAPTQQPAKQPLRGAVTLDQGVRARQTVLVPNSPRATRALLIDRASGNETPLPWPPDRPLGPGTDEPAAKASP